MSISTRITSMEQHIGNAYDKLDELGVDLTNVDKNLNNIAELLDGVYEDYPKIEENDVTEPSINNTKAGKMEIDLKGNTDQFTTTGKNLLPQNKYIATQTINGITYTNNGDGTFSLSGTATANTTLLIIPTGQISLEANQPYYFSSSTTYDSQTFNISIVGDEGGTIRFLQAGAKYTYSQTPTQLRLVFYIDNGKTVSSNAKNVKLQLERGSSATSYEPYTNGASPNPDYPQDVEVVTGENTVKVVNKNLFDNTVERKNAYINDYTIGTTISYSNSNATYTFVKCCYLKAGNTYKLSWKQDSTPASTNARNSVIIDDDNKIVQAIYSTWDDNITEKTIIPTQSGWLVLSTDINVIDIQIEEGSTATTYTEHKEQDLPISLHSRNLFDISKIVKGRVDSDNIGYSGDTSTITLNANSFSFTTTANYRGVVSNLIIIKPETQYHYKGTNSTDVGHIIDFYDKNGNWLSRSSTVSGQANSDFTFTTISNSYYMRLSYMLTSSGSATISNPQLEEGTTATTYQSFYDYELCKIEDYKDYIYKNDNKWYLYKEIEKVVFDGSENWEGGQTGTVSTDYTYVYTNAIDSLVKILYYGAFCDRFKNLNADMSISTKVTTDTISVGSSASRKIRIMIKSSRLSAQSISGFKTWLSTHNTDLYYVLATPTDIEITDTTLISQLNALEKAKSYDDTTNIIQENNDLPFILDIKTLKKS